MSPRCRFLTLLAAIAGAMIATPSSAAPHPAVARIVVQERGVTAYGSGTLIDKRDHYGLVVTNWHVVCDAQGKIEVVFPSGFRSEARALKVDEDWDLAALVIWRPPATPVSLASEPPRPGDPLTICGYGQGEYREATGRCVDFYAPEIGLPHELVELSVEARQGDSGGPILNARGELAGVLFGAGQGTTLGSFGPRVGAFLASLAPDIGRPSRGPAFPSTPPLIAHAPPRDAEASDDADGLAPVAQAQRDEGPASEHLAAAPATPLWPEPTDSADKPERSTSSEFQEVAKRSGDKFAPWPAAERQDSPTGPTVAALPAGAGADATLEPPAWFDTAKSVLAVVGLVFVFLQLVRLVA